MSYFIKYKLSFVSDRGNVYDLHILQKNYAGQPIVKKLGVAPVLSIEDGEGRVKGSSLSFAVQADVEGELKGLYTTNNKEFKVLLYRNSSLYWQGFVLPELYSENYIDPPYDVAVTASDQLGVLKNVEYQQEAGYKSLLEIIAYTLSITHLDLKIVQHLNLTLAGKERFLDGAYVATEGYYGQSCYDVLNSILLSCNACIQQYGSEWVIMSLTDVSTSYNKDGVNIEIPHAQLGQMGSAQVYPDGSLEMVNKPAVKGVTLNYAHVLKNSFLKNADCQSKDGWQYSFEPLDNRFPGTVDEFGVIYKCNCWQLPQKDVTVSGELQLWQDVNVKADNTYNCQLSVDYRMDLGASLLLMAIIHEGVDGITRRLTSEGWKEGVSDTDRNSYINVTGTPSELWLTWAKDIADFSKYEKATVQFQLPAVDGVLRIGFINTTDTSFVNPLSGQIYLTKIYLTYMGIAGKASTTVVEEDATNAQEEISLAYGERVPASNEALVVLNTLRSSNGIPMEQFSLNNTSGVKSYDSYFLAMLQEMSRYYAVKKMHLQGVVMGVSPLHLLYKDVFSGKVMRLVSGEYDLLQDTLSVLLEEVPDAWVDYEPEVYATDNSVPGVSSSGVVTVGGGGGTSLLAVNAKGEVYVKDERVLSGAEADFGKVVLPAEKPEESSDKVYIYSQVPAADEQLDNKAVNVHLMVDELVELRDDFDALNDLLNSDVAGVINTWDEIVDFLNEYGESQDLASILSQMNTDIANRVLYTDFEKLEDAVDSNYKSISNIASTIPTIESNIFALTTRVGGAESVITTIQATYVDKASAQEINGVKTFKNGLKIGEAELVWDSTNKALKIVGSAYITKDLSFGGYQAPGGGGTSGGGIVTIKVNGQEYTSQNGIITLPNYPSLAGYATESWVGNNYLELGGGTIEGDPAQITLKANRSGADSWLQFTDAETNNLHAIGIRRPADIYGLQYRINDKYYNIYHTGNFNPANYLPLSGGTIEGRYGALSIKRNSANASLLKFENTDGVMGYLGFSNTNIPAWYTSDVATSYAIIHSGNIGSQSVNSLYHKDVGLGNYYFKPFTYGYLLEGLYPTLRLRNTNEYNSQIEFSDKDDILRWSLSYRGFNGADNDFYFYKANNDVVTPVLALDYSSGNVLIGATEDNGAKLQVNGNIHTKGVTLPNYTAIQSYLADGTLVNLMYMNDANLLRIGNSSHKTAIMSAYVGIYTSNPAYTLDINGSLNATTIYQNGQTLDKYYLPLSGGILGNGSTNYLLTINAAQGGFVKFISGTTQYSAIGADDGLGTWITEKGGNYINIRGGNLFLNNANTFLHSDNIGSYNAGSATKLQNARTIWGQSFDGSGDVSGPIDIGLGKLYKYTLYDWVDGVSGFQLIDRSGNTRFGVYSYDGTKKVFVQNCYGGTENCSLELCDNGSIGLTGGNVLIGSTSDNGAKLQVNGAATMAQLQLSASIPIYLTAIGNGTYNRTVIEYSTSGIILERARVSDSSGASIVPFIISQRGGGVALKLDGNNLTVTGDITFGSDARYKNKITDVEIDLATIANAPLFIYKWNDREDNREHLGTTAQYWFDTAFKHAVIPTNDEKLWTMSYSEIAMGNTIVLAREQIKIKSEVEQLKEKVRQLEDELDKYRRVA